MREKNEKMIAANELRIGNWANNGFKDYQVSGATIWQLGLEYATALPIPLTEEWLLRFGFKNDPDGYDECMNGWSIRGGKWMLRGDPKNGLYCIDNDFDHKIHYVHQLQNLFHSLSGEELTIKER